MRIKNVRQTFLNRPKKKLKTPLIYIYIYVFIYDALCPLRDNSN